MQDGRIRADCADAWPRASHGVAAMWAFSQPSCALFSGDGEPLERSSGIALTKFTYSLTVPPRV